ncbi:TlpA disulfide reductase family protein [Chitinophaga ginsengisegetis]|uniref:TlpA disulfide reductase family protein n=1 Tax=Chitinophaga ginsengisegetis TaxID=393003 RepID=UPI000DBF902B|nr:TlpA disulfide reductase family protein [Chitinophaga ginsengisegetis]MDR6571164.1 thiol-disulfide isomerase/thioredoxin [Chitinophaga ginsengisegetis]MDR6650898.1 thiol-disulfide isomerase/thioredoxin [Chitinophaga ginsengisegetis]MDR6657215.1 thiol-disulfide isomerase/thioredoxin [Chitinophaga ginsengisegetis]
MKNILSIFILLPGFAMAQQQNFYLKGTVEEWRGKDSVFIYYLRDNKQVTDSTVATDGHFEFKGSISQPVLTYIALHKPIKPTEIRDNYRFYLEEGNIRLHAKDSLRHSFITSGKVNADYQELEKAIAVTSKRLLALKMEAVKSTPEQRKTPAFAALEKEYYTGLDSMEAIRIRFIKTHPASFMSLEALNVIAGNTMQFQKTAPLFEKLSPSLKQTPLGKDFASRLETAKKTLTGVVMPSFTSLDTARKEVHLKEVVQHAKVTLVDFWASWCAPCRAENPNVVKAFNAFHEKGFDIISVSLDDNADRWKAAIIKDGMPWYHVSGLKKWDEPVAQFFGIQGIPDNFLLDEQGRVIARGLKGVELYNKIAGLLEKK